jgi:short-subunit dehydrogenase
MREKLAIITGSSSGLGKSLALYYASQGYNLGLIARTEEKLKLLSDEIQNTYQRKVVWKCADIADVDAQIKALDSIIGELGEVDIFIANAGHFRRCKIGDMDFELFKKILMTNTFGTICGVEYMIKRTENQTNPLSIGVIATTTAFSRPPYHAYYSASKCGLVGGCQAIQRYLVTRDQSLTLIFPGYLDIERFKNRKIPFKIDLNVAVKKVAHAIKNKKHEVVFDWRWKLIVLVWKYTPMWVWKIVYKYYISPLGEDNWQEQLPFSKY